MKKLLSIILLINLQNIAFADWEVLTGSVNAPEEVVNLVNGNQCEVWIEGNPSKMNPKEPSQIIKLTSKHIQDDGKILLRDYDGFDSRVDISIKQESNEISYVISYNYKRTHGNSVAMGYVETLKELNIGFAKDDFSYILNWLVCK